MFSDVHAVGLSEQQAIFSGQQAEKARKVDRAEEDKAGAAKNSPAEEGVDPGGGAAVSVQTSTSMDAAGAVGNAGAVGTAGPEWRRIRPAGAHGAGFHRCTPTD